MIKARVYFQVLNDNSVPLVPEWASLGFEFADQVVPGNWDSSDWELPGIVSNVVQCADMVNAGAVRPQGALIATVIRMLNYPRIRIGWIHIEDRDIAGGVYVGVTSYDTIYGTNIVVGSNSALFPTGVQTLTQGEILQNPSSILINKVTSTPVQLPNGRNRTRVGRWFVPFVGHKSFITPTNTNRVVVNTSGAVLTEANYLTSINTNMSSFVSNGYDPCVVIGSDSIGATYNVSLISSFEISSEVATQRRRLLRGSGRFVPPVAP